MLDPEKMGVILITDCGSTTSKARLFKRINGEYRFIVAGEAPTTVEAPYEDVTLGICNAIREIEELMDHKILSKNGIIMPSQNENKGVDLYATTSSAGGGLQMVVAGVAKAMTGESAERVALGAGAIVMDIISIDDSRKTYEKIEAIQHLRPDMILVAGGTDGGTVELVVDIAELLMTAQPKARLGASYDLPIVYAGNKDARKNVKGILGKNFALKIVENIRPEIDVECVEPARKAIHECFMEHVMSHAPGYDKLTSWTEVPIMPTPSAEGRMFRLLGKAYGVNVIGVGLGGATTNVYSIYEGKFVRTVSANLGMSYSVCNVLKQTGIDHVMRWLPFEMEEKDVRNKLTNKMIRPTTIPQTVQGLIIEHAVAREALRLAFRHHRTLARGLRGLRKENKTISDIFDQSLIGLESYIDLMNVDIIAGTGGLLSHAPNRSQAALILIDGFLPEGVTKLMQDSVFMIPHLGVLSTVHPKAALEIFEKDCIVKLGTCIAPKGLIGKGKKAMTITGTFNNEKIIREIIFGDIEILPLSNGESVNIEIAPAKGLDVGAGIGNSLRTIVEGGVVGVIVDARGRPLVLPVEPDKRRKQQLKWIGEICAYPTLPMNN